MEWRGHNGVRLLELELPAARAAFSTRIGGVSAAEFASLNLGLHTGDTAAAVAENRARLAAALGLEPGRIALSRQVHGDGLLRHDGPQSGAPFAHPGKTTPPEADAHATESPGLGLLVLVADCLPIALSGPGGVAIVHAGWRGLAAGVVERGVEAVAASDAAIGPGIGPCCYEVGSEVLAAFGDLGEGIATGAMLDLPEVARRKLEAAGVGSVEIAGLCTHCDPERFYSHRGLGPRTGRQAGVVWRTG